MKTAVLVAAMLFPLTARSEPKTEKWEMLVSVVDDSTTDFDEKVPDGNDKTTDRAHTEAKVSVIFDAVARSGGYDSVKMVSLTGDGTSETSHARRFKTVTTLPQGNGKPQVITTTIEEDFTSKGKLAPLKTTTTEMMFAASSLIVVAGTLHFTTELKNHSKKVLESTGAAPIVNEDNNGKTQDETTSISIAMAAATKAMVAAHRYSAVEVVKVTDKRMTDRGMKGTKTTTVDIHPLGKK